MEIRKLVADDVEIYRAIRLRSLREHPEAFGASYEEDSANPVEADRGRLETSNVFVAFDGGLPVGIVGTFHSRRRAKAAHIAMLWGMYVAPEARRRGLGRRLIDTALANLDDQVELVQLGVGAYNTGARALYAAAGFETYGVEKHAIKLGDRYIDEELMVLTLQDWKS